MEDTLKQAATQPVNQDVNGAEVAPIGVSTEAPQRPVGEFVQSSNPLPPSLDEELDQFVKPVAPAQVPVPSTHVELPQTSAGINQQIGVEEDQVGGKTEESSSWWHKLRAFSLGKREEREKQPTSA